MDWTQFLKVLGPVDGMLAIAIYFVWREWRKSEERSISLLQDQVRLTAETVAKYSSFEGAIRGLTEVIKKEG
jgi:hypothetical protein